MDIKKTRKSLGLTLQEAGDLIGVTREYVRRAEGGTAPTPVGKLAQAYRSVAKREAKNIFKTEGKQSMHIEFDFTLEDDGSIRVQYVGDGPQVESVADLIVRAIAADENMTASKVRKSSK